MKKIDDSKSVWYKKYIPFYIDDLIIPIEMKNSIAKDVKSEDIPHFGLFSSQPGCLLPGNNITVYKEQNFLKFKELKSRYNLTKSQIGKLRYYTDSKYDVDENLITDKILKIVKLSGSIAYKFSASYKSDNKFIDKHLKLMHWVYKFDDIEDACNEVSRIRKFSDFIDININNKRFDNYKKQNLIEILLKIKFNIIYSNAKKITDLCKFYDKNTRIEYWTFRGWSEQEAKEKISNIQKLNMNKRILKYTKQELKYQRGYGQTIQKFINIGFSEQEAKQLLKERQSTNRLDKFQERYGKELGLEKWKQRQIKWQETLKSKTQEEIDDINRRKSNGYNNFKYSLDCPGKLYYIHFYNNEVEFWKIGITKNKLDERFNFDILNLEHNIIFEKYFDDIYDAYLLEQKILKYYNKYRIKINLEKFNSTECFNKNVLEKYLK